MAARSRANSPGSGTGATPPRLGGGAMLSSVAEAGIAEEKIDLGSKFPPKRARVPPAAMSKAVPCGRAAGQAASSVPPSTSVSPP